MFHNNIIYIYYIFFYLLSSNLESYLTVRLKLASLRPFVRLYRSERKMTESALVNSALVPAYFKERQPEKE